MGLKILSALSSLLILGGAAVVLAGTLGPWATFRVFHNLEINLPGLVFLWGGLCLTVASLVFLGMRRSPLLCLVGAVLVFGWVREAQTRVPERVKFQLAGSQAEVQLTLNRLLDQFHIPDIEVADLNTPNPNLLGDGLAWTQYGGIALLLGSLLGLPGDPAIVWAWTRAAKARCRVCGVRWPLRRRALYCPECGAATTPAHIPLCPRCHTEARAADRHCIACGEALR